MVPTYPKKIYVWGCFSSLGFGSLFIFESNLNSQILIDIYEQHLLKSAQNWFGLNSNTWWLLEDNDPKHTSKMATKYREENKIQKLDFPSYSPDLNPIEKVWGIMKNKISQTQITSINELKKKFNKSGMNLIMTLPLNYVKISVRVLNTIP